MCILASPAFAQGANTITIIHDDGSKDVVEIGRPAAPVSAPPAPRSQPSLRDVIEKTVQPPAAPDAVSVSTPQERAAPPVPQPASKPRVRAAAEDTRPPKPGRKPDVLRAAVWNSAPVSPESVGGAAVTADDALQVALGLAPPSRRFDVQPRALDAGFAFAVTFKTERGDYEVLVDSDTGSVISKGYVGGVAQPTLPGHLPAQ